VIEICVDSVASAMAAERGGAARVELCSDLSEGGITPSAGLIELVRERISIGLQVMIRPRAGNFCYSPDEFETMQRDILVARRIGADGVVFGILTSDGGVDVQRTKLLAEMARPLNVTFHRAFDMSCDLMRALNDICAAGVNRVLTSGGEQSAVQGIDRLAALVKTSSGRIAVMAGGGVREHNIASIVEQTGVREIHSGIRTRSATPAIPTTDKHRISLGTKPSGEYEDFQVSEEDVRKLCAAAALARIRSLMKTSAVIGVISDTHGSLRPEAVQALRGSDYIIHAGDVGDPEILDDLRTVAPVTAVRGNVDKGEWSKKLPEDAVLEIAGIVIYVLHDLAKLDLKPKTSGFAAVVSGHSHVAKQETQGGVLYFNPGSAGPRRFKFPISVGKLFVEESGVRGEILTLPIPSP
jgi:copper homeostasis protein